MIAPPVSGSIEIPEEYHKAVKTQSAGVYSKKLPLIPVCIRIDGFNGKTVFYTIYYFPIGTLEMSYNIQDGYNIEKPLTGS
jgi:hypothetical protein